MRASRVDGQTQTPHPPDSRQTLPQCRQLPACFFHKAPIVPPRVEREPVVVVVVLIPENHAQRVLVVRPRMHNQPDVGPVRIAGDGLRARFGRFRGQHVGALDVRELTQRSPRALP